MSEELPREEGLPSEEGLPREEGLPERTEPYCDECGWASSCVYLFGFAVVQFVVLADVASGCVLSLLMVAACLMVCVPRDAFTSAQKEDGCLMRAALLIYVLGLLLLVVAIVLLAMKTHRVTSLPDPTCEPWAGSCQEGVSAPTGASSATTAPTRYPRAWTSTGIGGPRGAPGTSQLEILAHTGVGEGQDA